MSSKLVSFLVRSSVTGIPYRQIPHFIRLLNHSKPT